MSVATRMSGPDAAWLHMDRPTNLMVINVLMLFDEPVDAGRLREVVQHRLVERYPRFRRRVVEGRLPVSASWREDPHFDLDRHFHHIALPAPADERAVAKLVGDLMVIPLNRARPLWDLYLVDGCAHGSAVIVRMHHCIADGIALARVLLSLTDASRTNGAHVPELAEVVRAEEERPLPLPPLVTVPVSLGVAAARLALEPRGLLRLARAAARDGVTAVRLLVTPPDSHSALKGRPGAARQVVWSQPLSLPAVKEVAHANGVTVNDTLLSAVGGALRGYLRRRHKRVGEVQAMVPVNLRRLSEPVPRELGNMFGLVYVPLGVRIHDPFERLRFVHERMEEIKRSRNAPVSYELLGAMGMAPTQVEQPMVDLFADKSTAVITNVPGPREVVYLAGSPVRSVLVWAPTSGHLGMSVSIFSYRQAITVGLMVDPQLVPLPERVLEELGRELERLRAPAAPARERHAVRR